MLPDKKRRMVMTGREIGEAGRRDMDWIRKNGTGRVLRCANWVEAVGTAEKVEKLVVELN
jgi:hypothetical protein